MNSVPQIFTVQRCKRGIGMFGVAHFQFGAFGKKQRDETVGCGFGYDDAFGGVARLPRIAETGIAGFCGGAFQVGIGHHDKGVAAAELQHGFLEVCARVCRKDAPRMRRTGKRHRIGIFDCLERVRLIQPRACQRNAV